MEAEGEFRAEGQRKRALVAKETGRNGLRMVVEQREGRETQTAGMNLEQE